MKNYKKIFLVLLLAFTLANLTFCFMPDQAKAQVPEISQHSCDESAEEKTSVPQENSVLPCCQDHYKIIKIDSPKNDNYSGIIIGSLPIDTVIIQPSVLKKTTFKDSLDLPPPEGESLSSIIKKE